MHGAQLRMGMGTLYVDIVCVCKQCNITCNSIVQKCVALVCVLLFRGGAIVTALILAMRRAGVPFSHGVCRIPPRWGGEVYLSTVQELLEVFVCVCVCLQRPPPHLTRFSRLGRRQRAQLGFDGVHARIKLIVHRPNQVLAIRDHRV